MKILSLDLSSTCTGYTKFDYNTDKKSFKVLEVNSIKPKSTLSFYERIEIIDNHFASEYLYTWPDVIVIESYAFGGKSLSSMAELNGIIKYHFHLNGHKDFIKIAPNSVKKIVTGKGSATKEEVQVSVSTRKEFKKIVFKNCDESDSSAVGLSYIEKL